MKGIGKVKENNNWLDSYKEGGKVEKKQWAPNPTAVISQVPPIGSSAPLLPTYDGHHLTPTPYQSDIDKQIKELRARQDNTPAIGAEANWRQKVHNVTKKIANVVPGPYSVIPEMLMYPVDAAVNLTEPSKYFENKVGYEGFMGVAPMALDAAAIAGMGKAVLEPFRFKPNPNYGYRVIGDEAGLLDAQTSGRIRANPMGSGSGEITRPSDVAYYERGKIGNYPGKYVFETSEPVYYRGETNPVLGNTIKSKHYGAAPYNEIGERYDLPLDKGRILKKDWLRGYKEVKVDPKIGNTSENNVFALNSDIAGNHILSAPDALPSIEARTAIEEGRQVQVDWLNSDEWLRRRMSATGESEGRAKVAKSMMLKKLSDAKVQVKNLKDYHTTQRGISVHRPDSDPLVVIGDDGNYGRMKDISNHEMIHASNAWSPEYTMKGIPFETIPYTSENPLVRKTIDYLNRKPEQQVRGVRLLQFMNDDGIWQHGKEVTNDMIKKLKTSKNIPQDVRSLTSSFNDEQLKNFLNKVYTIGLISTPMLEVYNKNEETSRNKMGDKTQLNWLDNE